MKMPPPRVVESGLPLWIVTPDIFTIGSVPVLVIAKTLELLLPSMIVEFGSSPFRNRLSVIASSPSIST